MGKSYINDSLLSGSNDYKQAQVYLSFLGGKAGTESSRVPGLMVGELSVGAGASWNTPLISAALENISQTANMGKAAAEGFARLAGHSLDLGAQIQLKSLNQTINFWTGSERPSFTIELMYISMIRGFDVREHVMKLYSAVMPLKSKSLTIGGANLDVMLDAPLRYDPIKKSGVFTVQIGEWFRAPRQVMKSVQFTFSQELVPLDGEKGKNNAKKFAPLYAKGSITFEPYRDLLYSDFAGYFRK